MTNHCGECTMCCRLLAIPELNKPAGTWCQHCKIGAGCKIYNERPKVCRDYACLWLLSQSQEQPMAPELRPDKSKVVISPLTDPDVLMFTVAPGAHDAWRKPIFKTLMKLLMRNGFHAVIGEPNSTRKILVDKDGEREIEMTEPDTDGMQHNVKQKPARR